MNIKPIETRYNGYRFRSRLEARWAVFFDQLGIKYQYEKQGYDLGKYGRYLPDFWLEPAGLWAGCWVEIKGYTATEAEKDKLAALTLATNQPGFMFIGDPYHPSEYFQCYPQWWSQHDIFTYNHLVQMQDLLHIIDESGYVITHNHPVKWNWSENGQEWWPFVNDDNHQGVKDILETAQLKARQTRFEHGEQPRR